MKYISEKELQNDASGKNYAFGYDEKGFYTGVVRRQPHPIQSHRDAGEMLMPANCVEKKPVFKEGFKPKWNGSDWDLVSIETARSEVTQPEINYVEQKQDMFSEVCKSASEVVQIEAAKSLDLKIYKFLENQSKYQLDILTECRATINYEVLKCFDDVNAHIIAQAELMRQMIAHCEELKTELITVTKNNMIEVEQRRTDVLIYAAQVQSQFEALNAPGFWEKIKSVFGVASEEPKEPQV